MAAARISPICFILMYAHSKSPNQWTSADQIQLRKWIAEIKIRKKNDQIAPVNFQQAAQSLRWTRPKPILFVYQGIFVIKIAANWLAKGLCHLETYPKINIK